MSMQINVDPAGLTQEQREAVAGFILAYPGRACAGSCHTGAEIHDATHTAGTLALEVTSDTTKAAVAVDALAAHAQAAGLPGVVTEQLDPEIALLAKEGGEFEASVAFGGPVPDPMAAAAFGSAPAPLAQPATVAPSIAVAAPSLTAPAAMPGTTSTATSTVPAPPAPITAPAAPAPTAHAAPSTPASGVEVDKHGLPWDGRIHAGTKRKNADGSWTTKRGVAPALVAQVEAELRQVMGAPGAAPLAPAPTAPIPAPQAAIVTTPTAGVASSAVAVPAPPAPAPAAPVAPVPPAPSGDARQQFVGLVGRASAAIQAGKVTQAEVNQCCADAGVPALPLLANRLDLVPQVAAHVDALIAARQ